MMHFCTCWKDSGLNNYAAVILRQGKACKGSPPRAHNNPKISDHAPVTTSINFNFFLQKPRWKLDPLLLNLNNPEYESITYLVSILAGSKSLKDWITNKCFIIKHLKSIQSAFRARTNNISESLNVSLEIASIAFNKSPSA